MESQSFPYEIQNKELVYQAIQQAPSHQEIEKLADFYKIMGDSTRLRLLISLENGELCASDLANLSNMSRSAVSHQLKSLRQAKLVKSRKEGKTVYYSLDDEHIYSILKVALEHVKEDHEL